MTLKSYIRKVILSHLLLIFYFAASSVQEACMSVWKKKYMSGENTAYRPAEIQKSLHGGGNRQVWPGKKVELGHSAGFVCLEVL